jgi:hypothetical protein
MRFLAAHLKAADKEETFGKAIQRRINLMKAGVVVASVSKYKDAARMSIKPRFEYYLPKNDLEKVEMLVTANAGKAIISQKTSVAQNPLIEDGVAEYAQIEKEDNAAQKLATQFNNQ